MPSMTGCFHITVVTCIHCSCTCIHCSCTCTLYAYICVFDKLIWRTIGFLFDTALWASGTVNYNYIVTNGINSLLIGSRCIPNCTIWPMLEKVSETVAYMYTF